MKKMNNIIGETILNGNFKKEDILLQRIPMVPIDLVFNSNACSFWCGSSFAMTINKA